MPRIPKYRRHKGSNRAVVQCKALFGSKRLYLDGAFNSPESLAHYERIRAEIVARLGMRSPTPKLPVAMVGSLLAEFGQHAKEHYSAKERGHYRVVGKMLFADFAKCHVADFGPLKLQELREKMIDRGWCRNHVNRQTHRVRRIFKWGTSKEMVPASVYTALMTVEPLRSGKTRAPETEAKRPADWATVERLTPFLLPTVRAMVELQWLTGMRSDELCGMRVVDFDTTRSVWLYEPKEHKTAWRGKRKVVPLGPRCIAILRPYLANEGFIFSPLATVRQQSEMRKANRKTKQYGASKSPKHRRCRERYDAHSYQRSVNYGFVKLARSILLPRRPPGISPREWSKQCKKPAGVALSDWLDSLGISYWHPHQLRHTRATLTRAAYDLEGAQALLGNAVGATERYAEKSLALAMRIAEETG